MICFRRIVIEPSRSTDLLFAIHCLLVVLVLFTNVLRTLATDARGQPASAWPDHRFSDRISGKGRLAMIESVVVKDEIVIHAGVIFLKSATKLFISPALLP